MWIRARRARSSYRFLEEDGRLLGEENVLGWRDTPLTARNNIAIRCNRHAANALSEAQKNPCAHCIPGKRMFTASRILDFMPCWLTLYVTHDTKVVKSHFSWSAHNMWISNRCVSDCLARNEAKVTSRTGGIFNCRIPTYPVALMLYNNIFVTSRSGWVTHGAYPPFTPVHPLGCFKMIQYSRPFLFQYRMCRWYF